MNEILFALQVTLVAAASISALFLRREGLVALIAIEAALANLFVMKQVELFGLTVTCSDAFAVGSILGLNLLQERCGFERAQRATWVAFFSLLFFAIMAQIHLLFVPSPHDASSVHFTALLTPLPRLFLASLTTFFIVQQIDLRLFRRLRERLPHLPWLLRSGISLLLVQLLDTALFTWMGLSGSIASMTDVILWSFSVKVAAILLFTGLLTVIRIPVQSEM
jgi:hypothetical protein